MKKFYLLLPVFAGLVLSCSSGVTKTDILNELKVKLVQTLSNPSVSEDENGNVFITQDETIYALYLDNIFLGNLDDDNNTDVAYSIAVNTGGNLEEYFHYSVMSSINREIELKLKPNSTIRGIEDKKIGVKTYSYRDTDPRCCPSIEKIKRFGYIGNKMVEID
jgi:hypothetical protein